jgi:hypothetical protein
LILDDFGDRGGSVSVPLFRILRNRNSASVDIPRIGDEDEDDVLKPAFIIVFDI